MMTLTMNNIKITQFCSMIPTINDKYFGEWKVDRCRQFLDASFEHTIWQRGEFIKQWGDVVSIHCHQQLKMGNSHNHRILLNVHMCLTHLITSVVMCE